MMNVITIRDSESGSLARILPDLGLNCFQFQAVTSTGEMVEVVEADPAFADGSLPPSHHGIPLLFPFPNRIRKGQFAWNGKNWQIPVDQVPNDGAGHAIHGFCLDRPWRIIQQSAETVTGEFRLSREAPDRFPWWPGDPQIRVQYSMQGAALLAEITVSNPGDEAFPWGFGTHGYFRVPLTSASRAADCTVFAPCQQLWELESCLPTGQRLPVPDDINLADSPYFDTLKVDTVFTGVELEGQHLVCRILDERAGLLMEQRCHADFREIVAFTPPWSRSICLEPYTCVTDAINLQHQGINAGLQVLQPGQIWTGWIRLEVLPVIG